jgi:hypothetical protein
MTLPSISTYRIPASFQPHLRPNNSAACSTASITQSAKKPPLRVGPSPHRRALHPANKRRATSGGLTIGLDQYLSCPTIVALPPVCAASRSRLRSRHRCTLRKHRGRYWGAMDRGGHFSVRELGLLPALDRAVVVDDLTKPYAALSRCPHCPVRGTAFPPLDVRP